MSALCVFLRAPRQHGSECRACKYPVIWWTSLGNAVSWASASQVRYLLATLTRDLRVDARRPEPNGTEPGALLTRRSAMGVFIPLRSPSKVPKPIHAEVFLCVASRCRTFEELPSALEVNRMIEGREHGLIHRLLCRLHFLGFWLSVPVKPNCC